MNLDPSSLYVFSEVLGRPHSYVSNDSKHPLGEIARLTKFFVPPTCPNWPDEHAGANVPPDVENLYRFSRELGDLLWYIDVCLIKDKHVAAIAARMFSGIEFRDVNLYTNEKCAERLPGYVEMRTIGRVRVDEKRPGVTVEYRCPLCGHVRYSHCDPVLGLHFEGDYETWPDVFEMEQKITSWIFVKPRFAQLMVDMELRPLMLTRFEDIVIPSLEQET
ncbi:MAG: hypothetical protein ACYC96_11280 [Fimbriimonadaceae bacterium]